MNQPDAAEAVRMLDLMLAFFGEGEGWSQATLNDGRGGRCLLGALDYLERECCVSGGPGRRLSPRCHPPPAPDPRRRAALRLQAAPRGHPVRHVQTTPAGISGSSGR